MYKFSSKSLAVPSAVIVLLQGRRITPFVRPWSTTTSIESNPSDIGRSVIKYMEQLAKGRVVLAPSTGINTGLDGFQSILNCWQIPHPFT